MAVQLGSTIEQLIKEIPTKTSQLTNDSGFLTEHQDISGKANLAGGNSFTGTQTLTSPTSGGYSINAAGYVRGSWLQAPSTGKLESAASKVCVLDGSGWIYYRTPADIISDAGLTGVLRFIGTTATALTDGSTTNPIIIGDNSITAVTGDVTRFGGKEFAWLDSKWEELGDESSHALKTIEINAGTGLTGGGNLTENRTISLKTATASEIGGVKSGTDITVDENGNVSVNDDSHNHIIANVDGLSTELANRVTTNTAQTITADKTFNGELKFGSTEIFQSCYFKKNIGVLSAGTAYANLDSKYKDGTWHRMWRLRFPNTSGKNNFWGKIKITLFGNYSSFNASGIMSKTITCNFNASNIYNNVGCYDGLGVNVEKDFRISEAIWNSTANAWEILIWQKNLNGNNAPSILLECWTGNNQAYINAAKGITAQTVELTQGTTYTALKASPTGGTKTVTWATTPVYENPLGEEIATISDIPEIPPVTSADAGKFLRVSSTGTWVAETVQNAAELSV